MTCLTHLRTLPIAPAAVVVCCVLLAVVNSTSRAAVIEYSWAGTLEPLEADEDPWRIGAAGKPFVITAFVDEDAVDLDLSVVVARFDLLHAELLIDGVRQEALGRGLILIHDRDVRDILSILLFDVQFLSVREGFVTGLDLPPSALTFEENLETPPVFSAADTITAGGATSDSSSYFTFIDLGTSVRARIIPEPSTMVLALLAALGVGIMRSRNRIR